MSVLKITPNKHGKCKKPEQSSLIQEELFCDEIRPMTAPIIGKYQSKIWGSLLAAMTGIFVAGVFAFWFLQAGDSSEKALPFVFFELKAIDYEGHPVAGADVEYDGRVLGKTDSFGEWRRFMKVKLGSEVTLKVEKLLDGTKTFATKSFVIPKKTSNHGEIEFSTAIQLLSNTQRVGSESRGKEKKFSNNSNHDIRSPLDAIWFSYIGSQSGIKKIGAVFSTAERLQKKILPLIKERSEVLGLTLNPSSQWNVTLQHLPLSKEPDLQGLILVSAKLPGNDKNIEFLKNYKRNDLATARSILWALKIHIAKEFQVARNGQKWSVIQAKARNYWKLKPGMLLYGKNGQHFQIDNFSGNPSWVPLKMLSSSIPPCPKVGNQQKVNCTLYTSHVGAYPPADDWDRLKIKLFGIAPTAKIFVSGYKAAYEGGKVWSYWGQPGHQANLTMVENGEIVYRKKIKNSRLPTTGLPNPGQVVGRK